MCKFLITPTQSNDTGSDNARQPTTWSQRQHALTQTATGFMVYIQHLSSPFHKHPIKYTCSKIFIALLLQKRCIIFLSSGFLRGVPPKGQNSPRHKGQGCCNWRLGSHQSARQAEIASLSTHCFCPQPSFRASLWAAAMSWSQRCGR